MQSLTAKQKQEIERFIREAEKADQVLRAQVVLMLDDGDPFESIHRLTGFSRTHAFRLRRKYFAHGLDTLKDKREGKPKELLTKREREAVIETVRTKTPKDVGFVSDHWTTGLLGKWIEQEYTTTYKSKTSLYLIFKQASFTYHKPGRVSERRDEQEVTEWHKKARKRIKQAWHDPGTVILTEDEMHLSTQTTVQKIWLPQGEYPKVEIARKRDARSIYGFLNVKTGDEHAFKTKWQNMYITASIIPAVRKLYPDKKILLVWDQAGWHKGSEAQKAIKLDSNIETIYFPTAAPDENPQEHVWKSGRSRVTHNRFIDDIDKATDELVEYFNTTTFQYALLGMSAIS